MPECWEPECKTPWTMHYHHESVRWNLYMLQRTCVWVSSTNVPCSLVTPLYAKLAWAPLLQIYENFHKTYTFRRVVARVVVRVVVAENKENFNFVFVTNKYPSNYPCPKCVFSYTLGTDACRASGRAGDCCQNDIFYNTIARQWAESVVNNTIWGRAIVRAIVALLKEKILFLLKEQQSPAQ